MKIIDLFNIANKNLDEILGMPFSVLVYELYVSNKISDKEKKELKEKIIEILKKINIARNSDVYIDYFLKCLTFDDFLNNFSETEWINLDIDVKRKFLEELTYEKFELLNDDWKKIICRDLIMCNQTELVTLKNYPREFYKYSEKYADGIKLLSACPYEDIRKQYIYALSYERYEINDLLKNPTLTEEELYHILKIMKDSISFADEYFNIIQYIIQHNKKLSQQQIIDLIMTKNNKEILWIIVKYLFKNINYEQYKLLDKEVKNKIKQVLVDRFNYYEPIDLCIPEELLKECVEENINEISIKMLFIICPYETIRKKYINELSKINLGYDIFNNPTLTNDELFEILLNCKNKSSYYYEEVSKYIIKHNKNLTEEQIDKLWATKNYALRKGLANLPNLPVKYFSLIDKKYKRLRENMLRNPNCPKSILLKYAADQENKYLSSIAKETLTKKEVKNNE
ncbi:MAG: hypothetical protein ACK4WJ_06210 [Endomicrobiia bacterium]